jgi:hypothetical protein
LVANLRKPPTELEQNARAVCIRGLGYNLKPKQSSNAPQSSNTISATAPARDPINTKWHANLLGEGRHCDPEPKLVFSMCGGFSLVIFGVDMTRNEQIKRWRSGETLSV